MEIQIAETAQKRFNNWHSVECFVESFLLEGQIPFKIEVDTEYKFVVTFSTNNRQGD